MIDVLIPTYNPKPAHLTAALRSLQSQSFRDWQALLHDDCSPNNETASIVEPFLADSRIRFVKSETRLGIGGNWNACLARTSAPLVAYLFQDDLWNPEYLQAAEKALREHPSAGFVSLEHAYKTEGGISIGPFYDAVHTFRETQISAGLHKGRELLRFWLRHELTPNIIGEPDFVVLRRSIMERAGPFHASMTQFLDSEYWLRLLQITDWVYLAGDYGTFRVHPSAASAVNQESGQGIYDRLDCFEALIRNLRGEDRTLAITARNRALQTMIAKFFARIRSGKNVPGKGSGGLRSFALRHPLLVFSSLCRYALKKS